MKTRLPADLRAPREARAFVAAGLRKAPAPPRVAVDEVVLVTSELVTNAVQAGADTVEVELHATPQRVELVVSDDAGGWPAPSDPAETETAGRGLRIVAQLSHDWDTDRLPGGKRVRATWFDRAG